MGLPSITVVAGDIDRMGHVNNSIYLRWIETAVHEDWRMRATAGEFAALQWIAVRHELDYRRPALLAETIDVSVRLTEVRRVRAWYESVISRDGVTLCEARSCWCCLDRDGRLTVIPPDTAQRIMAMPG